MKSPSLPLVADYRFRDRLRVRWSEIDMQRIVFNAHYLTYCDTAIANYWRALALPYAESMAQLQGDMYLRKATVEFQASAHLDDVLDIGLRCARIGTSSLTFACGIFHETRLLVACELVYVFADPATQTAKPVPAPLRALFEGFEAGAEMTRVATGTWADATLRSAASGVRRAVFMREQGIPAVDELDAADATALHAVVFNQLDFPVATARLLPAEDGVAHIGRMAVLRPLRRTGLGRRLLQALEQAARARGDRAICLSAQRHAEAFYRRLGYASVGEPYAEVGIPHIRMRKALVAEAA